MPYGCVEVVVKLKAPPQQLFEGHEYNDRIVMRLQPHPHFDIRIDMKAPGFKNDRDCNSDPSLPRLVGCGWI